MPSRSPTPRPPIGRLATTKPNPIKRMGPSITPINRQRRPSGVTRLASMRHPEVASASPPPQPKKAAPLPVTCPNEACDAPNIIEEDGVQVCTNCGSVLSEMEIVAEVSFGETSAGAAVVQGTFVGADQSHGRTFGPGHLGGGVQSREMTIANGTCRF